MPIKYSPQGSGIKPYQLTDADFLQIGRLIAGCAEIEDLIDLYFCKATKISEAYTYILFGRTSAAAKLKMLETLLKGRGGEDWQTFKDCFLQPGYADIVRVRNTVAHGWLLGITDAGELAFQVKEVAGTDEEQVNVTVLAHPPAMVKDCADAVWKSLPKVEDMLGLKALRKKRRELPLDAHRRAQFRAPQDEEPQPPPQS